MYKRYCGRDCFCDYCSAARNASAHKYLALSNEGKRYGETEEKRESRIRKVCNEIERKGKER